ncbi:hypothetical protein [Streptomyces sp. NPDC005209]|uniref:hypothetical protein n=1 Tax=Streptomyces sp. NPDC005209 TaxID=3156715 RepID=UPI0033BC199F
MAFGVEELRVLRRALALALHPGPASAEDVQDCLRLAESLDEAMREGARLRAFLVADLARYRTALPGTAAGYLTLLEEALRAGYRPTGDDLAALGALRANPVAAALLVRCEALGGGVVRARTEGPDRRRAGTMPGIPAPAPAPGTAAPGGSAPEATAPAASAHVPACRQRLLAIPGGRPQGSERPAEKPAPKPTRKPAERPAERPATEPPAPKPHRPIPTPGEVFPRRKPNPPSEDPPQQRLAAG